MKERMCRQMSNDCCCCDMMAMTMKGGLYIIVGINKVKRKQYEKTCIDNSSITEYQHQQHLG